MAKKNKNKAEEPLSGLEEEDDQLVEVKDDELRNVTHQTEHKEDEKEGEISSLRDKFLRLAAEFDNYKKRTARERLDLMSRAGEELMVALLPVLDDFDRAKRQAEDPHSDEKFSEGVELVYNKLYNTLRQKGLKEMELEDDEFDSELHEAITRIPVQEEERKGKIIDVIEKGYYLNDKIIRHAKVVIGD